jgi:lysophospholipase L1-like esterase
LPNVRGILNALPTDSKCTWVGPPKVNKRPFKLNNELKLAVSQRCAYVDSQRLPIQLRDGVHPTAQGARVWATAIAKEMR